MANSIPTGTLVRVFPPSDSFAEDRIITRNGDLWIVDHDCGAGLYGCRALLTGTKYPWYTHEFEIGGQDG